jgi:DNA ligase-1
MGNWQPTAQDFQRLIAADDDAREPARPYPFFLASPLEGQASDLGDAEAWQFEWKWDGIRAQLIHRSSQCIIWSRGEEIITAAFPEIAEVACRLPEGTVLDGELLAWENEAPLPFGKLQRRLNRKEANARLQNTVPVIFMAYDLLERHGEDWRQRPLHQRREELSKIVSGVHQHVVAPAQVAPPSRWEQAEFSFAGSQTPTPRENANTIKTPPTLLRLSPALRASDWETLEAMQVQARDSNTEGIMLKKLDSVYGTGRQRGTWWKWKVAPFVCDAVLIAAQPGHGRRATLFTDYTFAVWRGTELVPVAKAYSGLTNEEINALDAWVRGHTTGRYGPVRSVTAELVFELAFEGIQESTRHKSGLALRFPRISRQRTDKKPADADTVETLRTLLGVVNNGQ